MTALHMGYKQTQWLAFYWLAFFACGCPRDTYWSIVRRPLEIALVSRGIALEGAEMLPAGDGELVPYPCCILSCLFGFGLALLFTSGSGDSMIRLASSETSCPNHVNYGVDKGPDYHFPARVRDSSFYLCFEA